MRDPEWQQLRAELDAARQALANGPLEEAPAPSLPPSTEPEPAQLRLLRRLNRENGGVLYADAIRVVQASKRLGQWVVAHAPELATPGSDVSDRYGPVDPELAAAIITTARRLSPARLEALRRAYSAVGRRPRRRLAQESKGYPHILMAPPDSAEAAGDG